MTECDMLEPSPRSNLHTEMIIIIIDNCTNYKQAVNNSLLQAANCLFVPRMTDLYCNTSVTDVIEYKDTALATSVALYSPD